MVPKPERNGKEIIQLVNNFSTVSELSKKTAINRDNRYCINSKIQNITLVCGFGLADV